MTSTRRALLLVALGALLVRLAIWPWFAAIEPRIYDEDDYVDLATSLAERGEFAMNGRLTSARPPLYPAAIALVYRVAGVGNQQAVRLFQILLNVAMVPLVFALGRRLYDQRTGVVAAALAAFYPSLLGHDYLLLTEVLFTFLLLAGTVALVENAARPRWALVAAAGLAFGLGTLTRASLLFYPPLFAIATFAWWRAAPARRIATVLLFVSVFALTLAPWIARNTLLNGRLSSIDSYSSSTAATYSPLRHLFEQPGSTWAQRPPLDRAGMAPGQRPGRVVEDNGRERPANERERRSIEERDRARREHVRRAREHDGTGQERAGVTPRRVHPPTGASQPGGDSAGFGGHLARSLSDAAWDAMLFWRIDRELAGAAARGWLGPLSRPVVVGIGLLVAGYYVALMLAGLLGLVLRPPSDRAQLALVLSAVTVLFAVHAFSVGHSRYHLPVMPLLAVFAARLWVARGEPLARRRLAAGLGLAAVLVASWIAAFVRFDLADVRERLDRLERPPASKSRID